MANRWTDTGETTQIRSKEEWKHSFQVVVFGTDVIVALRLSRQTVHSEGYPQQAVTFHI